jgi:hypothetical protein
MKSDSMSNLVSCSLENVRIYPYRRSRLNGAINGINLPNGGHLYVPGLLNSSVEGKLTLLTPTLGLL